MNNRSNRLAKFSLNRFSGVSLIAIALAITLLAIGAVAGFSRKQVVAIGSHDEKRKIPVASHSEKNYLTARVAGQDVQVDGQTGQIKPLTPGEASRLADGIKQLVSKSSDGLTAVQHRDGSVSVDLQGRFQNVALARRNDDGSVSQSCVSNGQSAASFLQIDPQLFTDKGKPGSVSSSKANSTSRLTRAAPQRADQ
jgi:hypothetical protein